MILSEFQSVTSMDTESNSNTFCRKCQRFETFCICKPEKNHEETQGSESGAESFETFDLQAGFTSFHDRITNLINSGSPGEAVLKLNDAFDNATEQTIAEITAIAKSAYDQLLDNGYKSEANLLGHTLTSWGCPPEERFAKAPDNSKLVPALAIAPALTR